MSESLLHAILRTIVAMLPWRSESELEAILDQIAKHEQSVSPPTTESTPAESGTNG